MTKKENTEEPRKLFRVMIRGREYLGTAEQHRAKVVAPDFLTAIRLAIEALKLDPARLDGAAATLIRDRTALAQGRVFDMARRSRGFGERGGWLRDVLPARRPDGPRKTEAL
jgi:hypothetical protein